jgi:hypothetical protein
MHRLALPFVALALTCLALSSGCTARKRPSTETFATCSNGSDDDEDGLLDCADPDCIIYAICAGTDGGGVDAGAGDANGDAPRVDANLEMCAAPIDLTFVLDVSTSMAMEAGALRDGIGRIFAAAQALTTDTRFGLVVFVDDALVVGSCSGFASAADLQTEFDRWRAFCASNDSPVSEFNNSDCAENSLDAIWAAATQCTWRPEATHILIHVTDDTFEEPPYVYSEDFFTGAGVPAVNDYADVSRALVTREIRVGAFAMEVPEDCGGSMSRDTARGFFTPYMGMPSLPMATGGRVWDIRDVRSGTLDMATAITEMVENEYCTVF